MHLPDAAQKSLQDVFIANHWAEFPELIVGSAQGQHLRALSRGESADAFRQEFSQRWGGSGAGNVMADSQQPHLVVVACRLAVAVEQDGRVEGVLVRRV